MGAGQEKDEEARRDDGNREMGRLSSAVPEMITVEKCVEAQRTEEVVVREKPQQRNVRGQEQLRWAGVQTQGEGEQWAGADLLGAGVLC